MMTTASLRIRNLEITPPLLLAPMVSLTHSALRQVIAGFGGAGLLSTEMLSAKRLPHEKPSASPYLIRTGQEKPLSYQLLASAPGEIPRAVDALHAQKADAIDLNLGCPAPAVSKRGGGASLMDRPEEVRSIVAEIRRRTSLPLTAKIRLGADLDGRKLKSFCAMLEGEGLDLLSVHARLKEESFGRRPRWESVAKIKEWLSIPVIANGGIFSVRDAEECQRVSGADGLMLGRGAAVKPWLFARIAGSLYGFVLPESTVSLPQVYRTFFNLLVRHFSPEHRLNRLKQFTRYFSQNYAFGHHLASRVQSSASMEEALERAEVFFERNEPRREADGG